MAAGATVAADPAPNGRDYRVRRDGPPFDDVVAAVAAAVVADAHWVIKDGGRHLPHLRHWRYCSFDCSDGLKGRSLRCREDSYSFAAAAAGHDVVDAAVDVANAVVVAAADVTRQHRQPRRYC